MTTCVGVAERPRIWASGSTRSQQTLYVLDRAIAVPLLLAATPIICAAAITVGCLSRRPPFVAHLRVGRFGQPLWILKIRTMWDETLPRISSGVALVERLRTGHTECKAPDDPRVASRFARFCRKYSIDELPQLAHVVLGDMSIIGPRPITGRELETYYGDAALEVLGLRPGLSGLWQVMGRNRLTYTQRRRLDTFLVRHFTFGLYFRTLLRTIPSTITGRDAW